LTTKRSFHKSIRSREPPTPPTRAVLGVPKNKIAIANTTHTPIPENGTGKALSLQDARVHYAVPKQQPRRTHHHTPTPKRGCPVCGLGHAREPKHQKPQPRRTRHQKCRPTG